MLIDAGNNEDSDTIIKYLKQQGVKKINTLIGTHPHEDHIGAMDIVNKNFDIGKIYMPNLTTTTQTFKDVVLAIRAKGMRVDTATAGVKIDIDPNVTIQMIAPNSGTYEDPNNYSAVIRLTYGSTSFLLTADAEDVSEKEMLAKKYTLHADVLKVGHHASKSSTTTSFLKAVAPKYAVISVGKDNDYGHPAKETVNRLTAAKIQIFRTDLSGTIIASSDGKTVILNKKASAIKPQAPPAGVIVYITGTGKKYHKDGCRYISKSKI